MLLGLDPLYWILVGPFFILAIYAQIKVKTNFNKYKKVVSASGMTGAQAAHAMLRNAGLDGQIKIEMTRGFLSDHYHPKHRALRLSPEVFNGRGLSAVGVACHEAGHAIQHATEYGPLTIRNSIVPMANIGSWISLPMIILGVIFSYTNLIFAGIIAFSILVVFQLINLPVEFNASTRAKNMLSQLGIISGTQQEVGVAKVLNAAALTYVAATAQAVMQLVYFLSFVGGSDD